MDVIGLILCYCIFLNTPDLMTHRSSFHTRVFLSHCILLLMAPFICYSVALYNQHIMPYFPAISACYFQYPENVIFPICVCLFALSHFYFFGGVYYRVDWNRNSDKVRFIQLLCPKILELFCGVLLVMVSCLPFNHPLHGFVALSLFVSLLLWQVSRNLVDHYRVDNHHPICQIRRIMSVLSACFLVGILYFFPYSVNQQSMMTTSFSDQVYLLAFHPDWHIAAFFEWALFLNSACFFLTFLVELNSQKSD